MKYRLFGPPLPTRPLLSGCMLLLAITTQGWAIDSYEPNEDPASAYDLRAYPATWLNTITGDGLIFNASDTDYFRIASSSNGYHRLQLALTVRNDPTHNPWVSLYLVDADGQYYKSLGSVSNGTSQTIDMLVFTNDDLYVGLQLDTIKSSGSEQIGYTLWWDLLPGSVEDPCEWNDSEAAATDLTTNMGEYVSAIYGSMPIQGKAGSATDFDYYRLHPSSNGARVRVEMPWDSTRPAITLLGYQPGASFSNQATYFKGVSFLDTMVTSTNSVFLRVNGNSLGTPYDLRWQHLESPMVDDALEDNDTLATATDTIGWSDQDVYAATGIIPRQRDSDWYKIEVTYPEYLISVTANFSHALGDIDLRLCNTNGATLSSSTSTTNTEVIQHLVDHAGPYYLHLYGQEMGNEYLLGWSTAPPPPDLRVESFAMMEISGTPDGRITAGDVIEINPTIRNHGQQPGMASNVVGTLVSTTAFVTVTQPTGVYSNIPAQLNRAAYATNIPVISVSPACPGGFETDLDYRIAADNAATVTGTIHLAISSAEDAYEDNDTLDAGYLVAVDTALSMIEGTGTQGDDDWYRIQITEAGWLYATCSFVQAYGDLSLSLFDLQTNLLEQSDTQADHESVAHILYPGTYALLVAGPTNYSDYDLTWSMGPAAPPEIHLVTNAITAEAGPRANDDGDADPGETVTLSFTLENTGELRATNVVISLEGGDAVTTITSPPTATGGTINAGATMTWTGLAVAVDWTAADESTHPFDLIATDDNRTWTNTWTLEIKGLQDDTYEYNSAAGLATTSLPEQVWLSTVAGAGRQVDFDYYRMDLSNPSNRHYRARVTNANTPISLRNLSDAALASSSSDGTNLVSDHASLSLDPVLVRVSGANAGEIYDLFWETLPHYVDFASHRSEIENDSNTNGLIDPGEIVRIYTTLTNLSALAYSAVPVTLSSPSPDVAVLWSNTLTDAFAPGGISSNGILGFRVQVAPGVASNSTYVLTATCDQSNGVVTTLSIPLTIAAEEDAYEPDDTCETGFVLPPDTLLSSISGTGILGDTDYYRITVTAEYQYVHVTCTYVHAEGNIGIELAGQASDGSSGTEVIHAKIGAGTTCIVVSGDNQRNAYDLSWSLSPAAPAMASIVNYGIASGDTDNDGQVDPNETIHIWTVITNSGELSAHGSITLQVEDTQVSSSFTSLNNFYLPGGTVASNEINGWFRPAPDYPVGQQVPLEAVMTLSFPTRISTQQIPFLIQGISDDQYETNYFSDMNFFPEETWLSSIGGPGVQKDWDRYPIRFDAGYYYEALCDYNKSAGDLLFSMSGVQSISTSATPTGVKVTAIGGSEALVSLVVTGDNSGVEYDLYWSKCGYGFSVDHHFYNDDPGNQDGFVAPGESGHLIIAYTNYGCAVVAELTGTLSHASTPDPYLTINQPTVLYPDIPVGGVVSNPSPYVFSFATNTPAGHTATVHVYAVNRYGAEEGFNLSITCESPATFALPGIQIDDDNDGSSQGNGNGVLNPNESVEISLCWTNVGSLIADNIEVTLSTTTATANVIWNWRWYHDIDPGTASCSAPDGPFLVNAGNPANGELHLQAAIEYLGGSNQVFDLYLPVVPAAPAEFAPPGLRIDDDSNDHSEGNGDGILDPGESIELHLCLTNIGEAAASELQVDLSTTNDDVTVIWTPRWYEDIAPGEASCTPFDGEPFLFEIDNSHPVNQPVHLRVDLTFDGGDDQTFHYHIPVSSLPAPNPLRLELTGPATAPELDSTPNYVCLLRYDDNSSTNVTGIADWTNSNPLVEIFAEGPNAHIVPGIIFSNETTSLTVSHNGWSTSITVNLVDQPYPLAAYDFQNATPGVPPTGWLGNPLVPSAWSVLSETNRSPTNRCLSLVGAFDGSAPAQVAKAAFIPAYLYIELWLYQLPLAGANPTDIRTRIDLSPDATGLTFRRPLFSIRNDGTLLDMNLQPMATVSTTGWDRVDVLYLRRDLDVIAVYWHGGEMLTPSIQPQLFPQYEETLAYFLAASLRGSTLLDDIAFAVDPFPAILEAQKIEKILTTLEGVSIDWAAFPAVRYFAEFASDPGSTNWSASSSNHLQAIGDLGITNLPTESQFMRLKMLLKDP